MRESCLESSYTSTNCLQVQKKVGEGQEHPGAARMWYMTPFSCCPVSQQAISFVCASVSSFVKSGLHPLPPCRTTGLNVPEGKKLLVRCSKRLPLIVCKCKDLFSSLGGCLFVTSWGLCCDGHRARYRWHSWARWRSPRPGGT